MDGRPLKYHEKKLLKKVNFDYWKKIDNPWEGVIIKRYNLVERDDYPNYQNLVLHVKRLYHRVEALREKDPLREEMKGKITTKLYDMGVISAHDWNQVGQIQVKNFCKRRLPTLLVKLNFCQDIRQATLFVQHGHIRVGVEPVNDPAFLVTRDMENFISWQIGSKVKATVSQFKGDMDDYEVQVN